MKRLFTTYTLDGLIKKLCVEKVESLQMQEAPLIAKYGYIALPPSTHTIQNTRRDIDPIDVHFHVCIVEVMDGLNDNNDKMHYSKQYNRFVNLKDVLTDYGNRNFLVRSCGCFMDAGHLVINLYRKNSGGKIDNK